MVPPVVSESWRITDSEDSFSRRLTRAASAATGERWNEEDRKEVIFYKAEWLDAKHHGYQGLLYCHDRRFFPTVINQHAAKATKATYNWLLQHRVDTLFSTTESYSKFVSADFPTLANKIYRQAEARGIDWACKFFTWMCVVDEQMERATKMAPGASLQKFMELHMVLSWTYPEDPVIQENLTRFFHVFPNQLCLDRASVGRESLVNWLQKERVPHLELDTGNLGPLGSSTNPIILDPDEDPDRTSIEVYPGNLGPLGSCLRDLWRTCVSIMPKEFNVRLAQSIQNFLLGNLYDKRVREDNKARIRKDNTILFVQQYLDIRRATRAVDLTMVIVDMVYQVQLPQKIFGSAPMQNFFTTIHEIITWHHDLWTFRKDFLEGDVHNLVFLISQQQNCSYAFASLLARQMVYGKLQDLDTVITDLLTSTWQPNRPVRTCKEAFASLDQLGLNYQALSRYIETCQCWIVSTQSWHIRRDYDT